MSMITRGAVRHVRAGEGDAVWVVGDTYTVKAEKASTGGLFGLIEARVPPGGGPPPHTHSREDEAYYVLSGALEFRVGTTEVMAETGDFVFLPRGIEHSFTNRGDHDARALLLITPGGFERFFTEVGVPVRPGERAPGMSPADLPHLIAATARYGGRVNLPDIPDIPDVSEPGHD
jgi:quercetin dioxygenase-like cupin family protein